ncbi:MAG: tetratricopeptide repeat protein [Candidatus Paceibacterota bacterium]
MTKQNQENSLRIAKEIFYRGKHKDALEYALSLARSGDVNSCVFVGWLLSKGGKGVKQDQEQAIKWLELASNSGSVDAKYILGTVYCDLRKYDQAISSFKQASASGYSAAFYQLGKMYYFGIGLARDLSQAYCYFCEASKLGHIFGRRSKALMLIKGYKGRKNILLGIILLIWSVLVGIWVALIDPYNEKTFD